ncbi:protease [Vallitalea longa]|uniref:Protease n=1 Tax=Vallitalea longa TaxID=2936439 RepID=A0A9W5YCN6_9FIRM|nr:CPBP family intramembrane glutamic endopeptidase [Vallitalea longa]GKX29484.1 protease [Vallitalea longa]
MNFTKLKQKNLYGNLEYNRFLSNGFLIIFIFFVLWTVSFVLGRFISKYILQFVDIEKKYISLRRIITCGFQIIVFFTWVKFVERRKIRTLGFRYKKSYKFLIGFLIGIFAISVITIILLFTGSIQIEIRKGINLNMNTFIGIVLIVSGWIVQSVSEEIGIRGWLIPLLGAKYNITLAIFTTSIVFGMIHLFTPNVTVLSFMNIFLSGVFFALYAISEDCLWGVWGCHFGWNLALGNIYEFNVSGVSSTSSTIFQIKTIGNNVLTGGSFGPEGGLLATVILIVGIIIVGYKIYRNSMMDTQRLS